MVLGRCSGLRVSRVGVAQDAEGGIVRQDPLDPGGGLRSSIGDSRLACV